VLRGKNNGGATQNKRVIALPSKQKKGPKTNQNENAEKLGEVLDAQKTSPRNQPKEGTKEGGERPGVGNYLGPFKSRANLALARSAEKQQKREGEEEAKMKKKKKHSDLIRKKGRRQRTHQGTNGGGEKTSGKKKLTRRKRQKENKWSRGNIGFVGAVLCWEKARKTEDK